MDRPRLRDSSPVEVRGRPRPSSLISTRSRPSSRGRSHPAPGPTRSASPCSTAFWHSSVITIARLVATSAETSPKLPRRTRRDPAPGSRDVAHHPQQPVRHPIELDDLVEGLGERLVHDRDGGDPGHRVGQRDLRLGRVDPPGLHPQQRGHGLQVVLHPVVDLPDGGVLGDQLALLAAQVAHVAAEHDRTHPLPIPRPAAAPGPSDGPHRRRARSRRAVRPDSTDCTESSTGPGPAGNRSAVSAGQVLVDEVADQTEPPVRAQAHSGSRTRPHRPRRCG